MQQGAAVGGAAGVDVRPRLEQQLEVVARLRAERGKERRLAQGVGDFEVHAAFYQGIQPVAVGEDGGKVQVGVAHVAQPGGVGTKV